jgi:pyruvate ferredoxin oxidoreductase delta subunit
LAFRGSECFLVNEVNTEPKTRDEMPITPYSKPVVGSMGKTGSWRTFDPVIDYDKCNRCRTCWLYCPEAVISLDDDDTPHIDLVYCKGCGICAQVCPKECIEMVRKGIVPEVDEK